MSNYSSLKATINANVKANGNEEITGSIMNSVLNAMVASLGAGYQFIGVATPTSPGTAQTPDYKCFYLATTPGTYTNLGGLVVADGEVALLKWDNAWTKEDLISVSPNSLTEHTDIIVGNESHPVASAEEVEGNTIKSPYFEHGFLSTGGTFYPNENYRCSSFLPCALIDYLVNETDAIININYYDENKIHQVGTTYGFIDHKCEILKQYKYFRFWAQVDSIGNNSILWFDSTLGELRNSFNSYRTNQRYGNLMPFVGFDKDTITAEIGSGTTRVTIKGLVYAKKTNTISYLVVPDAIFDLPQSANMVVFGVIYDPNSSSVNGRYGYWTISTPAQMTDGEVFEPIAVCKIYGTEFTIGSGFYNNEISSLQETDALFNKMIKYRGGSLLIFTPVDESYLSAIVGVATTEVTLKEMVFGLHLINPYPSYYAIASQATLEIPNNANLVVIGVIYNPGTNSARYGYYSTSGGETGVGDNEYFEPLAICKIYNNSCTFLGGQLYERITAIKNEKLAEQQTPKPSNVVYVNDFSDLTGLGALKISDGTAAIPDNVLALAGGGLKIDPGYAFWPLIDSRINNSITRILFNTANSGSFVVRSYGMEDGAQGLLDNVAEFDITNGTISIYQQTPVPYSFNANSDYWIEIHRIDKKVSISMVEVKTGDKTEIGVFMGNTQQNLCLLYDIIAIGSNDNNSIIVKSYRIESGVDRPRLIIVGDSITVGFTATMLGGINANCYAHKIGEASGMNWLSSGRGGGIFTGLLGGSDLLGFHYKGRLEVELSKLRPDYVMVTMGTNGGGSYADYRAVIDKILQYGATPILNKLPIRASTDHIHNEDYIVSANAIIEQIWKDYHIDGVRFDLATSLNNDGDTIDPALFIEDYIHPNDAGHLAMYERALIDCPYLFLHN